MTLLSRSVTDLRGVGEQLASRLAKLHIYNLQDVLFHMPYKYVDRTRIYPLATVRMDDQVVIEVIITKVSLVPKPRRCLILQVQDSSGVAEIRFFHFNAAQQGQLKLNTRLRCFGQARYFRNKINFIHPEYKVVAEGLVLNVEEYLTPIYHTVDGVGQKILRNLVQQVLQLLQPVAGSLELLPKFIIDKFGFEPLMDSLQQIHYPTPECYKQILNTGHHPAQRRLAFEELLAQHLSLRQQRLAEQKSKAHAINVSGELGDKLIQGLPFSLTNAQVKTIEQIVNDLRHDYPMLRLVQGDVGCGKTLVAIMAALQVIESGMQVAFMAPTEILVEQHYNNIKRWFEPLNLKVLCLTSKNTVAEKKEIVDKLQQHAIHLLVGTHAMFQEYVQYSKLGLVIIDEQHRFGVAQRLALHKKGIQDEFHPHQLILTATPIPRTLAMTFYADLDYSVIDELPPGRKPITTALIANNRREEILARIKEVCATGQQVYWVCTLIEESDALDCKPAEDLYTELQQQLSGLQIGLIHGRMHARDKEFVMAEFSRGNIKLLVATTVIEVGVDVPNASLMVIENAERLGLAQLHQLRGRVGRGSEHSYCVLLYKKPLSARATQRLQFMRDNQDGFALAEFDLQLRGPGEIFGTRQSGLANLRIADLIRDKDLLPKVATAAEEVLENNPNLIPSLLKRWLRDQIEYAVV